VALYPVAAVADNGPVKLPELRDLIDMKVVEVLEAAVSGGWSKQEILMAIEDCLDARWVEKPDRR
jgi:hypothetical protein